MPWFSNFTFFIPFLVAVGGAGIQELTQALRPFSLCCDLFGRSTTPLGGASRDLQKAEGAQHRILPKTWTRLCVRVCFFLKTAALAGFQTCHTNRRGNGGERGM